MKRIHSLMILIALFISFQTLSAQSDTSANNLKQIPTANKGAFYAVQNNPAEYAGTLKVKLGLSDVQYQKILAIQTDYIAKRKDARQQMKDNPEGDQKQQMKSLKLERNTQIKELLTPGQIQKWNAWKKQKGEEFKSGKTNMPNPVETDEGF